MKIGSNVWHCKRIDSSSEIITYGSPTKYTLSVQYLTVQPSGGYTDTLQYGEAINRMWRIVANERAFDGVFTEGDVLYLDGASPTSGARNGLGANALVKSVRVQNRAIVIMAEKQEL